MHNYVYLKKEEKSNISHSCKMYILKQAKSIIADGSWSLAKRPFLSHPPVEWRLTQRYVHLDSSSHALQVAIVVGERCTIRDKPLFTTNNPK